MNQANTIPMLFHILQWMQIIQWRALQWIWHQASATMQRVHCAVSVGVIVVCCCSYLC